MTAVPQPSAPVPAICFLHLLAIAMGAAIAGHELRQLFRRAA
jgi:hypothetical protein